MGNRMRSGLLGLAVVVVAVVAGCGSSNDNGTTTTSLTKAQWIAKADAICKTSNQAINQAGQQQFGKQQKPSQADEQKFVTDTVIPNVQKQLDDIKALGFPDDQASAILDSAQSALDRGKQNPTLLTQNDQLFAQTNKMATAYGLKVCGSS
jgi:hypothetical protein